RKLQMLSKIVIFWRLTLSWGACFMSLFSFGVAFLPESECKSIAFSHTAQAFRELFFRKVHKTLIFRKIKFGGFCRDFLLQLVETHGRACN
ncbi:MAG: hypothetical protein MJZ00_08330, partial [Paludibacteraceae bacterium]|nr:hypothetical protein [Paludibacteraceae bacterium]